MNRREMAAIGVVVGLVLAGSAAAGTSLSENPRAVLFYGRPCQAGFNGSDDVSVQDIFDFLAVYFAGCP